MNNAVKNAENLTEEQFMSLEERLSSYGLYLADKARLIQYLKMSSLEELKELLNEDEFEKMSRYRETDSEEVFEDLITGFSIVSADKVLKKIREEFGKYRTKSKATDSSKLPENMAVITAHDYQNGLSLSKQGEAFLQPFSSTDGLRFKDGKVSFKFIEQSEAFVQRIQDRAQVPVTSIDLPLLRTFYSIILNQFENNYMTGKPITEKIKIYVPELAACLGKDRNISKNDIKTITDKVSSFQSIVGVLKDSRKPNGIGTIVPLLLFHGYFEEDNTIEFSSPYMNLLIKRIYNVSIRKDKKGNPKLKTDGTPLMLPSHSYLIKTSITKERNKKAVEIVTIVVTTIEQSGTHTPHISARTIIERNILLQDSLDKCKTTSNKNLMLQRAFKRAWELLPKQTDLLKKYPDIVLPDPNDPKMIPTMSTLDAVFEFPHS